MDAPTRAARPLRVLVVEDDDETRLMLREALTDEGYEVLTAQDGLHALRVVAAGAPDAIVLDFDLPLLSGPEVLATWRERRPEDPVPVIGMSALLTAEALARELPLAAFLRKPFDIEELLAALREGTGG